MKLLIFGSQTIGGACLNALLNTMPAPDILGVVAAADDPPRPGADTANRSLEALARSRQLPLIPPDAAERPEFIDTARSLAPERIFLFDYPGHLAEPVLALPPQGTINLYTTLLPAYRGHAPHIRAVQHGETVTGVTLHLLAPGAGSNSLLAQQTVPILWGDTGGDVHRKQADAAAELLRRTLPSLLAGQLAPAPLPTTSAPPFGPLRPEERAIDWNRAGVTLYHLIRAVTHPYSGAYAGFRGRRCTIWRSNVRPAPMNGPLPPPGTIIKLVPFQVVTGAGLLLPRRLQFDGEPERESDAFIARHQIAIGERFTVWPA
ncbi:MAG: formyltransferase family protein [Nitrospirota bacterium]